MGKDSSRRARTDRDGTHFLALPHVVIESPSYRSLTCTARALLTDIAVQFSGSNNGKLSASAKALLPMGWRSNDTISRSLRQLTTSGLLFETRKGARPNKAAWFAVTWLPLDKIAGMEVPGAFRRGAYKDSPQLSRSSKTRRTHAATLALQRNARIRATGYNVIPSIGARLTQIAPTIGLVTGAMKPSDGAISRVRSRSTAPTDGKYLEKPSAVAPAEDDKAAQAIQPKVPRERRSATSHSITR